MANPPKNQLWRHTANGCFESCLNGLVLDIPNASKEAHSQLITWPADSKSAGLNQKWNLLTGAGPHADESGPIVSRLHGLCMAVAADKRTGEVKPGSEVIIAPAPGTDPEEMNYTFNPYPDHWRLTPYSHP